jgi:glyoxylase-like metal-dependent hydrolase (beta-lactamase superfamily II)
MTAAGSPDGHAPTPVTSMGPTLNADGYVVSNIAGSLYWVTDSVYQCMFLTTTSGVVLVDAPPSIGRRINQAIGEATAISGRPAKVTHIVYSHSHADHIGAASTFGMDVERIGHAETGRLLSRDDDPRRPPPTVTFTDTYTLTTGGERLELSFRGPNHSADSIFIFAPYYATLMLVDVVYPGWVPFRSLGLAQDVPGWFHAHDQALEYPFSTLVGGHLGRLGSRDDVIIQKSYLADLSDSTRAAVAVVDPAPLHDECGPNVWARCQRYTDLVCARAAWPVITKYSRHLAGADIYTGLHAAAMLDTLRRDRGELGLFGRDRGA